MNCQFNIGDFTCQCIATANAGAKKDEGKNYCGVNPVTGKYGIRDDPFVAGKLRVGGLGNIRPGSGGPGGFHDRSGAHNAVDITAPVGTKIVASMDGTVIKVVKGYGLANSVAARKAQNGGYGNCCNHQI